MSADHDAPAADGVSAATPMLHVVRGEPTATEVAVLTALLAARSQSGVSAGDDVAGAARGGWNDLSRALAPLPLPGPNAWRASGR